MSDNFYDLFKANQEQPHRELATVTPLDPERAGRYARKALLSECENVASAPVGKRNHALNKAAFSISQLVAGCYLQHEDAWNALRDAARSAGLEDAEIEGTLASGFRGGSQTPRVVAERPPVPDATILDVGGAESVDGPPLNPLLDWHALFSTDDEEEEWIIEPILPARRMIALYSAPKAGKSLLMLEMAVGMSRGTEVIGALPDRARRVLYVDFENDPRGDVRTRLEAMGVGPDDLENLCYLSFPSLAKLDTQQGSIDLMRHVEAYQCEVVVIDTLSRSVAGEENENDTWLAFYRHTGLALKRAGIACIRLDHSGKDTSKGMRGGSAKAGDVDAVWSLTAVGEDTIVLECTANRMPVPTKQLSLLRREFPLRHVPSADPFGANAEARIREVESHLDVLGVPNDTSGNACQKALKDAGHKHRRADVLRAVQRRKLRLDTHVGVVPEPPGNHPEPPGVSGSGGGSYRNHRNHPGRGSGTTPGDPDELVGCKSCFKPTTRAVADKQDGLCAGCFRATGQTT